MSVYLVIESYPYEGSDVLQVFADEADANKYVEYLQEEDDSTRYLDVQEWEVQGALPQPRTFVREYVLVQETGFQVTETLKYHFSWDSEYPEREHQGPQISRSGPDRWQIRYWIEGYDVERCRKIATEKGALFLADFALLVEKTKRELGI